MGRPASNGAPSFRFNSAEVTEMESILQAHKYNVPERDLCQALADKFSRSAEREGKVVVQMKQIWNWFQNRRYAIRAKNSRAPGKLNVAPLQRNDLSTVRSVSQAPQHLPVPPASSLNNMLQVPQPIPAHSGQNATKNGADNSQLEFEAKSSRDGAWYDVSSFLSHRSLENGGPAVLVRFAGFGPEEDEWINVQKNVRLRSLPCESSECVAVLPNDLILCFQEGKEQALYYDAHVLDAQRRRHDARGCRCRFLVRYDHDQSEEIVALRKVCRRPETDYRLQQLHADSANSDKNKSGSMHHPPGKSVQVNPITVADSTEKKPAVIPAQTTPKQPVTGMHPKSEIPVMTPVSFGNMPSKMSAVPLVHSIASLPPPSAGGAVDSGVSKVTTTIPVADNTSKQPTTMITSGVIANTDTVISLFALTNTSVSTPVVPMDHSNAPPSAGAVDSNVSKVINTARVDDSMPMQPHTMTGLDANTCEMPMNHSNSPLAVSVDSSISVSVSDTTPEQPANTPPLTAPDILASADVNISTVPDSHSNASLFSASAGAAVDSSVSTMVTNTDPAALSSMLNQPSSTGVDANTGAVISPVSPANTSVDSSVVSVHNTDPVLDSSSSLTYTASPATILNDAPVVTEITTSLEKSATIDDEGNLNNGDADPVVASGADNLSIVTEDPVVAGGANHISDVTEDPVLAGGANHMSDVTEDPVLAGGANHISDVTEDPVLAGGANHISDVTEDPVLAGGANHISDVTEDPVLAGGANHISDVTEDPVLASGANHISDVTEDPVLASAANHISDVTEDPVLASGANLVSDVSEDPGVASGANLISDVSEDPGENMQID